MPTSKLFYHLLLKICGDEECLFHCPKSSTVKCKVELVVDVLQRPNFVDKQSYDERTLCVIWSIGRPSKRIFEAANPCSLLMTD